MAYVAEHLLVLLADEVHLHLSSAQVLGSLPSIGLRPLARCTGFRCSSNRRCCCRYRLLLGLPTCIDLIAQAEPFLNGTAVK